MKGLKKFLLRTPWYLPFIIAMLIALAGCILSLSYEIEKWDLYLLSAICIFAMVGIAAFLVQERRRRKLSKERDLWEVLQASQMKKESETGLYHGGEMDEY